ncbi:MAG: hypothetical protein RMJ67_08910 [Elusimicrobiota bacterium]|nr:hypothetical protein [Endomicrobiia bacterium]MDW8166616.1 hypothetical protein [Elusimicrobiota bacterium]
MEVKIKEYEKIEDNRESIVKPFSSPHKKIFPILHRFEFFTGEEIPANRYRSKFAIKRKGG